MPFVFLIKDVGAPAADPLSLVHGAQFDSGGANATDINYTPSGHQADDVVFAIIHNDGDVAVSASPANSTLLSSELNNGAAHARAYQVDLAGGEGALTWTLASGNEAKADFITVRGCDTTTPVPAGGVAEFSQSSSFSSIDLPSATVGRDGSWFFHSMSNDTGGATIALSSWPAEISQSSPDERRANDVGEANSLSQFSALETGTNSGSTGTRTYTIASNESMQTIGIVIQPAEGGGGGEPAPPGQVVDIPGANKLEAGTTGNNASSGGELTGTTNQVAAGPDGTTVTAQRPAYTASRQNSKHGWVFSGGADHIKLGSALTVEAQQLFIPICLKPIGEDTAWDSDFPRAWAIGDKIYLTLIKGTTSTTHKLEFYRRFGTRDARFQTTNDVLTAGAATVIAVDWDDSQPSTPPVIYKDGAQLQLSNLSIGQGTPQSTAGLAFHIGNRQYDDAQAFFLNRGFYGDIYEFAPIIGPTSLADKKTAIDEIGASWGIAQSNPFAPSIEAQSFTVQTGSAAGTVVGTVTAQNVGQSPVFTLTGDATTYYQIDAGTGLITVKAGATVLVVDTATNGTVEVNNGVGTDSATITVTVVEQSALKYSRPAWIIAATRKITTSSQSGDFVARPNSDNEDVEILAPSGSSVSANAFWVLNNGNDRFRNVAIIGGHYIGTDDASNGDDAVWVVRMIRGDFWMEGVRLTAGERQDGVQFGRDVNSSERGNWYFQRCWFDPVKGPKPSPHGDFLQTRGPVQSVYVDSFYGETGYQGFFMDGIPSNPNAGASIAGEFICTNGDVIRVDNRRGTSGTPYGEPNSTGTGATGGYCWWTDDYSGSKAWRIGHATDRTMDSVWCQKYSGIIVGSDTPTTPPNRMFWPHGDATRVTSGGEEWLDLIGDRGFLNVGDRPGGPLLAEGPSPGKNFVLRGSSTVVGGLGYT